MPTARIAVRVSPGSKRDGIATAVDGTVRVRVTAPPERGRANEAVITLLAGCLGLPRRAVTIVRGAASRQKVVEVEGLSTKEALVRLNARGGAAG